MSIHACSHLVLSKNLLEEVPSAALRRLHNLDHLNLNQNKLKELRKNAFLGLSKVKTAKSRFPGLKLDTSCITY